MLIFVHWMIIEYKWTALLQAISGVFGSGKVRNLLEDEVNELIHVPVSKFCCIAYLEAFFQVHFFILIKRNEIDQLIMNINLDNPTVKEEFSFSWHSEDGIVENIQMVADEYLKQRKLAVRKGLSTANIIACYLFS